MKKKNCNRFNLFYYQGSWREGIAGIPPFPFRSKTENDQKLRSNTLLPTENIDIAKCNYSPKSEFLGFPIGSYWIGDFFFFLAHSYILFLSCTKIWKIFFLVFFFFFFPSHCCESCGYSFFFCSFFIFELSDIWRKVLFFQDEWCTKF